MLTHVTQLFVKVFIAVALLISPSISYSAEKKLSQKQQRQVDQYYRDLFKLSSQQLKTLYKIWKLANVQGYGYTLSAMAWKESNLGLWKFNLSDGPHGSFGYFHIRLDIISNIKEKTSDWDKSRLADKLMSNLEYNVDEAIGLIKMWKKYHKDRKSKNILYSALASYNGGFKYNSKKAKEYASDIYLRMDALEMFFKDTDFIYKIARYENSLSKDVIKIVLK